MGAPRVMRRALAVAVIVALVAWLLVPLARAVSLVSPHPSDLAAPADLAVDDLRISADAEARGTVPLAAWSLHVTHGDPAVVLVHGFKTSRAEMLPWARFLHDGGFNVLLFDTRGCGRSGGATVGLGATEPRDISLAVEAAQAEFGTTRIAVLGVSLGAGAAILAAADDPRIAAVVADSAWTSQDFTLSRLDTLPLGPIRLPLVPYSGALVTRWSGRTCAPPGRSMRSRASRRGRSCSSTAPTTTTRRPRRTARGGSTRPRRRPRIFGWRREADTPARSTRSRTSTARACSGFSAPPFASDARRARRRSP